MISPQLFTGVINSYLPEPHASLLNGIVLGVSLKVSPQFYQQVKVAGLLHLVVLSGSNITMLTAVIGSCTAFLGKRMSVLITILTIIFFIAFVGPQAPAIRAGLMGILTLVAILYGRQARALYLLIISSVFTYFLGLIKPDWVRSLSFQLSVCSTLGIILFGVTNKNTNIIWKELKPALAAQVFTFPLIAIYFKQLSIVAPLTNILVAPLVPALMLLGFITSIAGSIHHVLGIIPAYMCFGILEYMVFVIRLCSAIPGAMVTF